MTRLSFCILALCLVATSCNTDKMRTSPALSDTQLPAFDMQGHRGARGLLPENTVPAMRKAIDLGVTTLEMDVHISQDGQVLLSHDPHINPEHELLPKGGEVPAQDAKKFVLYQMPYSQIKAFDVGSKFYSRFPEQQLQKVHKPLLSEVMDAAQSHLKEHSLPQIYYNIETKSKPSGDGKYHPAPAEFVDKLMAVIQEKNLEAYVIIQSFDVRTLQELHQKHPQIKTALLVENQQGLEQNLKRLGFIPTIYSPYYKLVTPALVEDVHSRGIRLIPWTVNELKEMKQLKKMGVDGLISDYPNLFRHL